VSWFKKAFAATVGYMTASVVYIVVLLVLAGGCCLCLLVAINSVSQSG